MSWAPDGGSYQTGRVTVPNFAPPGGGVATAKQNNVQVDAFVTANDRALWVSWAPDGGSYQTGRITSIGSSDNLFRPNPNGYSFTNYGGINPADLTIADLQRIFGDGAVCQGGNPSPCQPVAGAVQWLQNAHTIMNGGHCYGMATSSLRFYKGQINPQTLQVGATTPFSLPLSPPVRTLIAENFVRQMTDGIGAARWQSRQQTPTQILNQLIQSLQYGWDNPVVLDFWWTQLNGNGAGHSVTPYSVRDIGGGRFLISIYDNNFPADTTRQIEINTLTNRWSYTWGGAPIGGTTGSIDLIPLAVHNASPRCPWCPVTNSTNTTSQIWARGGQVVVSDPEGRRIGSDRGIRYQEIPGAVWSPITGGLGQPLPEIFNVPVSGSLQIALDGQGLTDPSPVQVSLFGNNGALTVNGGLLQPNERDQLEVSPDATAVLFKPAVTKPIDIQLSFDGSATADLHTMRGLAGSHDAAFTVQLHNAVSQAGEQLSVSVDSATGKLSYQGGQSGSSYDLVIERSINGSAGSFANNQLHVQSNDTHYLDYAAWDGVGPLKLEIDHGSDGTIDQILTIPNEQYRAFLPLIRR